MAASDLLAPHAEASAERGTALVPRFGALLRFAPVAATLLVLAALTGDPAPGDAWIGRAVQHVPLGWLPAHASVVLAYPAVMFVVWCVGVFAALRARNWTLVAAALLVFIALVVNPIVKEVVARPRPGAADLLIRHAADGYGFPSGHTSSATLMYGYAALALASLSPPRIARFCIGAAGAVIGSIAFERVYDGAHWPSDVAGGFISGVLLVGGCVTLAKLITRSVGYGSIGAALRRRPWLGRRRASLRHRPIHARTGTAHINRRSP